VVRDQEAYSKAQSERAVLYWSSQEVRTKRSRAAKARERDEYGQWR
jgi:hypothetical protein